MENLKGKKIANLYHESSYGKETIPVLNKQSEMYGFEVRHYPVPHPGSTRRRRGSRSRAATSPTGSSCAAGA